MENETDEEMGDEKREPQELNGIFFFLNNLSTKIKVAFQLKHTTYYYVHNLYIYYNSAYHNSAIKHSEQLN